MQIKSEFTQCNAAPQRSIDDVAEALHQEILNIRAGNNARDNCAYLTTYLLNLLNHYFYSAEKPTEKPPTHSSASDTNTELFIKKEDGIDMIWAASALSVPGRLHFELPPVEIEQYDLIRNEINQIIVLDRECVCKKPVETTKQDLNAVLINEAVAHGGMAYGHVALASRDVNAAGHMFIFLADDKKVIYVDAQLYNGVTRTGDPFFNSIHTPYSFKKDSPLSRQHNASFSSRCFYLVHSHRRMATSSLLNLSSNIPAAESDSDMTPSESSTLQSNQKQKKKSNPKRHLRVDAITGKVSALTGEALEEAIQNRTVIPRTTFDHRKNVDAKSGEVCRLTGEALDEAIRDGSVIPKSTFMRRKKIIHQSVYARSEEASTLTWAEHKRNVAAMKRKNNGVQYVNARTGEVSALTGTELEHAKLDGKVIKKATFNRRKIVNVRTGEVSALTGTELKRAISERRVISRGTFDGRKIVNARTGEVSTLTDKELAAAIRDGSVISKAAFMKRKNINRQSVDPITGEVSALTGTELKKARREGRVISKATFIKLQSVDTTAVEANTLSSETLVSENLISGTGFFNNKRRCVDEVRQERRTRDMKALKSLKPSAHLLPDV